MQQAQPIDSKQVEGFSSQFQRRWEAGFHWRSMCSMLLGTAGVRAAWPMSAVDYTQPECVDITGAGNHLSAAAAIGNVTFGRDPNGIAPIANFGGAANQYLLRVDGGAANWADVLGTENYILAADRGLTVGGWFWWAALPGVLQHIIGKDDGGANRQYAIRLLATDLPRLTVWPGPVSIQASAVIVAGWNHLAAIYNQAAQQLHFVLNGVLTSGGAGAAPAALVDSVSDFTIGGSGAGTNRFTGYASDCFLCAAALSHSFVKALYHYTKAAYGVK